MKPGRCGRCDRAVLCVGDTALELEPLTIEQLVGLVERAIGPNGVARTLSDEARRRRLKDHFVRVHGADRVRPAIVADVKAGRPILVRHVCQMKPE